PFLDYKPDLAAYQTGGESQTIQNALPRGDGYGPVNSLTGFTTALPAACRGYFYARNSDGSISIFAGTSSKLYKLSNTDFSWSDVSKGTASYSALPTSDQWQFVQFNN